MSYKDQCHVTQFIFYLRPSDHQQITCKRSSPSRHSSKAKLVMSHTANQAITDRRKQSFPPDAPQTNSSKKLPTASTLQANTKEVISFSLLFYERCHMDHARNASVYLSPADH
jgi:hypothetical protein